MRTGIKTFKILTHITYRFLWADLQLNEICKQTSDTGIKKTLKQIPKDLNATYERILDSTKKESQPRYELARKVLLCVAYSRSPIRMDFLRYAVSVEDDSEVLEALESSLPTETKILEVCTNLISIDKDNMVRFVHFSVQEFLTSQQSCIGPFDLGPESAHREIARMLITLLKNIYSGTLGASLLHHEDILHEWHFHLLPANLGTLSMDDTMVALVTSFFEQSPPILISIPDQDASAYFRFSPSALALIFQVPLGISVYRHYQPQSVYWETPSNKHLISIYPKSTPQIRRSFIIIFDDRFAMHYAVIVLGSVPVAQRLCNHSYPIHWFWNGLAQPARNFWSLPTGLNTWGLCELFYNLPPPLYFAECEKMAMFLLDNGASTDPQLVSDPFEFNLRLHDPLVHFAEVGNTQLTRLISDRIVYQHAQRHNTALQVAAYHDNIEGIHLLLDKGADVNAEGGEYGTALQVAAYGGNFECMHLLLDKGADVNAEGGKYGTTLQAAAQVGDVECIRLLLDKGVDVNAEGGEYGTALQAAAYGGNVECIRLLLDKGADVNAGGGKYGTALQAAAYWGKVECIRLLLDKGVDINAPGGEYGTALQAAACRGKVECIRFLLDKGVDVNAEGGEYGTALQAAGYWGTTKKWGCWDTETVAYEEDDHSVQCIQLLLDHGADINAKCGECGTALQAAAFNYRIHSIRLLLDKGADVNAEGGEYGSALQAASYACHLEVVKELLSNGANVNARVGKYGTALQAALAPALKDDEHLRVQKNQYATFDVLELLLDNGADIRAYVEDSEFGDALTAAKHSWKNDKESLDRFMKHWESGKRKGGQTTKCSR